MGGVDLERTDRGIVAGGGNFFGPAKEEWGAEAAVVGGLFGARGEVGGVGALDPPVIGDIEDDGILGEALFIEVSEEIADGFVEEGDHCPIIGDGEAGSFVFEEIEEAFGRVMWGVREHGGIPDEEGFFGFFGIGDELVDGIHGFATDIEADVAVAFAFGHAVGESASGEVPLPPFSRLEGEIAMGDEESGDGLFSIHVAVIGFAAFGEGGRFGEIGWAAGGGEGRIIGGHAVLVGILSRDDAGETGAAEGSGAIGAREGEALGGESIDVGGLDMGMAEETVVGPGLVIGDDHHHIGRRGEADGGEEEEGEEGERVEFHRNF